MKSLTGYISSLRDRKAALFMGAGISAIAGCSGLSEICEKLRNISDDISTAIGKGAVDPKELIAFVRDKCSSAEERRDYDGIMREGLHLKPMLFHDHYCPLIKKIKKISPFPPIVTTNVDCCLTLTGEFSYRNIFHEAIDMTMTTFRSGGIFHLHGYHEDKRNEVWDVLDYETRYSDQNFRDFISEIFRNYSVLYIGYAFGDQQIKDQMAKAKKENPTPFVHYALLPSDDCDHINEVLFETIYNVRIIRYGLKKDFLNIFGNWLDSNFSKAVVGAASSTMYTPRT